MPKPVDNSLLPAVKTAHQKWQKGRRKNPIAETLVAIDAALTEQQQAATEEKKAAKKRENKPKHTSMEHAFAKALGVTLK
jgi:hypothetical protein